MTGAGDAASAGMTLVDLVVLFVVAGICGAVAQAIVGYTHAGCLGSIGFGFIGALLGSWIAREMRLPELLTVQIEHHRFPIVWSVIGATLFVLLISIVSGSRWRYRTV
jgi:uncharacterized membrane protein YeaQ/YmgE (transglycosylase-associated protein family)